MLYYVAVIWNSDDDAIEAAARSLLRKFQAQRPFWCQAVAERGLAVSYHVSEGPTVDRLYALPNGQGAIFGRIFRHGTRVPALFNGMASSGLIRDGGRSLTQQYWGRYVAFLRDPETGRKWVLRDPTGAIPCHRTTINGIDIYFSRLEDCECLSVLESAVNHDYILSFLAGSAELTRQTGLDHVLNVLAGECIEHDGATASNTIYWNPFEFSQSRLIENPSQARDALRETVRMCVWAWASCFDDILLRLSGGLDSSIILSCLMDAPDKPRIRCQTDYIAGTRSDEREYARAVALRAHCELTERNVGHSVGLGNFLNAPRAVSPHMRIFDRKAAEDECYRLSVMGVSAIFEGHGGDEIFYKGNMVPTAVDFAWTNGLTSRLVRLAWNDANRMRLNFWSVMGSAVSRGLFRHEWDDHSGQDNHPLVPTRVMQEARQKLAFSHPLIRSFPGIPPGKRWHAYSVGGHCSAFWSPDRIDQMPISMSPLISQPLLELSLSIATYALCGGSVDRSSAREAFEIQLPREVTLRTTKGTPEENAWAIIFNNIDIFRTLLLDGYLVQTGCLDSKQLQAILSGEPAAATCYSTDFITYLIIESWAKNWPMDASLRVAA
jgi:asparagine synthase (glutamine-hydrolysing)